MTRRSGLVREIEGLRSVAKGKAGEPLAALDRRIAKLEATRGARPGRSPAYGYHSGLSPVSETSRGSRSTSGEPSRSPGSCSTPATTTSTRSAPGFGFPTRFKVEASDDPAFRSGVSVVADQSREDFANLGLPRWPSMPPARRPAMSG